MVAASAENPPSGTGGIEEMPASFEARPLRASILPDRPVVETCALLVGVATFVFAR
jgi:hypothetical protein